MFESLITTRGSLSIDREWNDFRAFAIASHQEDYGAYPFCYHLAFTESILAEAGFDDYRYRIGAWFHDIAEEDVSPDLIFQNYGGVVTSLVWACSPEGDTRAEQVSSIYEKLEQFPMAAPIKVASRCAHISSVNTCTESEYKAYATKYINEWPEFNDKVGSLMKEDRNGLMLWNSLCNQMGALMQKYG